MGRSAFIVRREGRYLFRTRWPRCLMPVSRSASIRIALGTAAYPVALRRASRIGAWMLRFKAAQTSEEALKELYPVLRDLAVRPVKDEDDLTERRALQWMLYRAAKRMAIDGHDIGAAAPRFDEIYLTFCEENHRAAKVLGQPKSYEARLEANRRALVREGWTPVVLPEPPFQDPAAAAPVLTPPMPKAQTTASKDLSVYGSASALASSKRMSGLKRRASSTIAGARSQPVGTAPRLAAARVRRPGPAATSRRRLPAIGSTASSKGAIAPSVTTAKKSL